MALHKKSISYEVQSAQLKEIRRPDPEGRDVPS